MSKIALIVKVTAAAGARGEIASAMAPMFDQVESEAGTELYIMHDDAGDPDVLWVYELYTDEAALQAHSTSPAMLELFSALGGDLVAAPPELTMVTPRRAKGAQV